MVPYGEILASQAAEIPYMETIDLIFSIIILIMSVVIHEVSHGYAAYMLGDRTAAYAGRLTLNPIKHLDPLGSIIIPLLLILTKAGFVIGWAKPVPYNPYNLSNQKWGEAWVAFAGPLSNMIIAILSAIIIRFGMTTGMLSVSFVHFLTTVVFINITLALFNLVPIPPLDGSKILFMFLPIRFAYIRENLERYGFALSLIFVFFLWQYFFPLIVIAFSFLTGIR